jgi:hypothetical protein
LRWRVFHQTVEDTKAMPGVGGAHWMNDATGQPEDATAKPTIRTAKDFADVAFDDFVAD